VFILGIMLMIPGIQVSVYAIPVWLVVMWLCYQVKVKSPSGSSAIRK
jgi:aromatic amino acid transport protein AroP